MFNKKILRYKKAWSGSSSDPLPAVKFIPEWYKKARPTADTSIEHFDFDGAPITFPEYIDPKTQAAATMKRCIPLFDAMSLGYMISTSHSLRFNGETGMFEGDPENVQQFSHDPYEVIGYPTPPDAHERIFKWNVGWKITLPKGYSAIYMHPMHRFDLPFYTLPGVVDVDRHPLVVNVPMLMKKGFTGTIPVDTPIIQVIPFKRESWHLKKEKQQMLTELDLKDFFEFSNGEPATGVYKRKVWQRKDFN